MALTQWWALALYSTVNVIYSSLLVDTRIVQQANEADTEQSMPLE